MTARIKPLAFSHRAKSRDYWRVRCHCGHVFVTQLRAVVSGRTRSCGCLLKSRQNHLIHGKRKSAEYNAWAHMIQRCENPNDKQYKSHGGAGITVCARWRKSFALFFADMGPKPSPRHTLDCTGHCYAPSKCRWVIAA